MFSLPNTKAHATSIDNTSRAVLTSRITFPHAMCEVDRSKREVSRAVPAILWRGWSIVLAAIGLLACAGPLAAAGCHVSDRPVLASRASWENALATDLSSAAPALAPPVLTHPPCQGETPRTTNAADGVSAVASPHPVGLVCPDQSGTIALDTPARHAEPPGTRLDRPPRFSRFCHVIAFMG